LKDADWVVEAVVERIDIKKTLYSKIDMLRKPGALVSSNTSSIPLKVLTEDMSKEMKEVFCITHFFNPVRYMRLLELVIGPQNDKEKINDLVNFGDKILGKTVVVCNDSPGFLGNRVGVYAMQVAMTEAFNLGLTIEEADAVFGRPLGIPKTGIFGLYDLIGIDLMADVLKSFIKELPVSDPFHIVGKELPIINQLIEDGYTGRKGKGGFFRMNKSSDVKILESLNYTNNTYHESKKVDLSLPDVMDVVNVIERDDVYGKYAWSIMKKTILYASSLVPDVTNNFNDIDDAMKCGFNWSKGPFEILDEIGIENFVSKLNKDEEIPSFIKQLIDQKNSLFKTADNALEYFNPQQSYMPMKRPDGIISLSDIKKSSKPIYTNASSSIWEMSGTSKFICVEFHTKANALDGLTNDCLMKAYDLCNDKYDGIVIANDAMQFSAGVNLNYFYDRAVNKEFKDIDIFLNNFQQSLYQLQHAKFPVVSCPSGLAIGGGYEIISQTSFIAAHSNSVLGLVESLVGLIPAGGGCKEMLRRWANHSDIKNDPKLLSLKVFNLIGYAITADSPIKARAQQFLGDKDVMVMSKDRLIEEADKLIFSNRENYQPLDSATFSLPGSTVMSDMMNILYELKDKKVIGEHGIEVGKKLGYMLSGGDTMASTILTEQNLYDLEREIFIDLISQKPTQERIRHTLDTGKPLFN
ncbi:3-hydroxyacyl-CoA dehydrogenase NAD-binding domain-containing protein, partial [Pelagibacteraceae bacterium]|nr:3-hydroxyacyl-CoA dehydrogenase NAD-binding domain-containing protein [Pelagibacteraceae bacterium]